MTTQAEKGQAFQELHAGDPFVIPNPWDAGSARVLQALGFRALATTSSGFAFTLGRLDGEVSLDEVIEHTGRVASVTDIPLSVDLENGYGAEPRDAALAVTRAAEAGAVGGSIEDYDKAGHIYALDHAASRIEAAAAAARALPFPFTLTARAENHIRGHDDLDDTIRRLQAYERAGANVLFAPGLRDPAQIQAVCTYVSLPVNVLATPTLTLEEIFAAGARRVSLGGSLTWVAVQAMATAATAARDHGELAALGVRLPLSDWFAGGADD